MYTTVYPEGGGGGGGQGFWTSQRKIKSGYVFLKEYWYGPLLRKQLGLGSNCFSREVRRSCVKYVDDKKKKKKNAARTPLVEFSGSAHGIYQEDKSKTITNENRIKSIDWSPFNSLSAYA